MRSRWTMPRTTRHLREGLPAFVLAVACVALVGQIADAQEEALESPAAKGATAAANVFRQTFFAITFFTIGLVSNFRKLAEEGIGRLAAIYFICLFGFIIWVGLGISWLFFHGVTPPLAQP